MRIAKIRKMRYSPQGVCRPDNICPRQGDALRLDVVDCRTARGLFRFRVAKECQQDMCRGGNGRRNRGPPLPFEPAALHAPADLHRFCVLKPLQSIRKKRTQGRTPSSSGFSLPSLAALSEKGRLPGMALVLLKKSGRVRLLPGTKSEIPNDRRG